MDGLYVVLHLALGHRATGCMERIFYRLRPLHASDVVSGFHDCEKTVAKAVWCPSNGSATLAQPGRVNHVYEKKHCFLVIH